MLKNLQVSPGAGIDLAILSIQESAGGKGFMPTYLYKLLFLTRLLRCYAQATLTFNKQDEKDVD